MINNPVFKERAKWQRPKHSLQRTRSVRSVVAQIMQQKTVGLTLKTNGRLNQVRKMSVKLTGL
jgi:hypothetical protein